MLFFLEPVAREVSSCRGRESSQLAGGSSGPWALTHQLYRFTPDLSGAAAAIYRREHMLATPVTLIWTSAPFTCERFCAVVEYKGCNLGSEGSHSWQPTVSFTFRLQTKTFDTIGLEKSNLNWWFHPLMTMCCFLKWIKTKSN